MEGLIFGILRHFAAKACVAPCNGIRIPETGKFLLMECGILGFGIQNPTNDWNPESKFN